MAPEGFGPEDVRGQDQELGLEVDHLRGAQASISVLPAATWLQTAWQRCFPALACHPIIFQGKAS